MEFNCPECGQRLRVGDHLVNPVVRCRLCGNTFRAAEATPPAAAAAPAVSVPPDEYAESRPYVPTDNEPDAELDEFLAKAAQSDTNSASRRPRGQPGARIGIGTILLLLLIGGKVFRAIFNNPGPPPAQNIEFAEENVEFQLDEAAMENLQQGVQQRLQELKTIEEERAQELPDDMKLDEADIDRLLPDVEPPLPEVDPPLPEFE